MKTVWIYKITFDGLVDKIGVASTKQLARQKVREHLGWVEEEANKPWAELLMDAGESNTGISIGEFEVDGKPITFEDNS